MDLAVSIPTILKLFALLSVLLVTYLIGLGIYRLYLSPLAAYPGPKLAALSNWYEFYYDVICQGQFTFKIQELHKHYGMVTFYQFKCHVMGMEAEKHYRPNYPHHTYRTPYQRPRLPRDTLLTCQSSRQVLLLLRSLWVRIRQLLHLGP